MTTKPEDTVDGLMFLAGMPVVFFSEAFAIKWIWNWYITLLGVPAIGLKIGLAMATLIGIGSAQYLIPRATTGLGAKTWGYITGIWILVGVLYLLRP